VLLPPDRRRRFIAEGLEYFSCLKSLRGIFKVEMIVPPDPRWTPIDSPDTGGQIWDGNYSIGHQSQAGGNRQGYSAFTLPHFDNAPLVDQAKGFLLAG
jgi:hypothetical protein